MDAAVGGGATEAGLVSEAVDVDVAGEGVHVAAAVEAGVEAVEPQDARGDGLQRQAVAQVADGLAGFEDGARLRTRAVLLRDTMQAQRCAVRGSDLADAELRGGADELFE